MKVTNKGMRLFPSVTIAIIHLELAHSSTNQMLAEQLLLMIAMSISCKGNRFMFYNISYDIGKGTTMSKIEQ